MRSASNLILQKVGARLWIARIMITWGVLAAGMALVTGRARSMYAPSAGRRGWPDFSPA